MKVVDFSIQILCVVSSLMIGQICRAQSETMKQFAHTEATSNVPGFGGFAFELIDIPYLLIPMNELAGLGVYDSFVDWLDQRQKNGGLLLDMRADLPEYIRKIIVVERNGKKYLRFFSSPYDTKYRQQLKDFLMSQSISFEEKNDLKGYSTSSRSLIVIDPETNLSFSVKPSTNRIAIKNSLGDRGFPALFASLARLLSDYLERLGRSMSTAKIAPESAVMGFLPAFSRSGKLLIDSSYSIRLMEEVSKGSEYTYSLFSLTNLKQRADLALKSGYTDSSAFLKDVSRILGAAIVEINLVAGLFYTSAHGQNARLNFDEFHKLKGTITFLDFIDVKYFQPIVSHRTDQAWTEKLYTHLSNINGEDRGIVTTEQVSQKSFGIFGIHSDEFKEGVNSKLEQLFGPKVAKQLWDSGAIRMNTGQEISYDFSKADFLNHTLKIRTHARPISCKKAVSNALSPGSL